MTRNGFECFLHLLGCDTELSEVQQEPGAISKEFPADKHYNYEELHSRPTITPDSEIPENLLHLP
ncbi:hypothetical protein GOODEAATRI_033432, partial [Goodea atripinnis]